MFTGMLNLFRFEKITELFPILRTDEQEQQLFIIPKNYPPLVPPTKFPKMPTTGTKIRLYASDLPVVINTPRKNTPKRGDILITSYMDETQRLID
jgi:hypothetical protein